MLFCIRYHYYSGRHSRDCDWSACFLHSIFHHAKYSFLLHKLDKKETICFTCFLPSIYFTYQIFSFRHWEIPSVLIRHVISLVISVIILILWIFYLLNKQD